MRRVYMDTCATTPVRKEVLEAMEPYFSEEFGNPSSLHGFGHRARAAVEDARARVASSLGAASPDEIIFTSGGTESDNLAVKGVALANMDRKRHIVTTKIEHKAVLESCRWLKRLGFEVTYVGVDRHGIVDPDEIKKALRDDTALVSVMLANNETGVIQPVAEIVRICHERGVAVHTDAVQAVGKMDVDVGKLGVDLLSLSGHKMCGPKGVGALYVRRGVKLVPLSSGGHHERRRRAGTENTPAIVGLARALELATDQMERFRKHTKTLRDRLQKRILEEISHTFLNGHPEKRLPHVLNISFRYVEGESLLMALDMKGVAASSASACTSATLQPSHVLEAMGLPADLMQSSVRFSLGWMNREDDIDYVVEVLKEIVERLRGMSPLYEDMKR